VGTGSHQVAPEVAFSMDSLGWPFTGNRGMGWLGWVWAHGKVPSLLLFSNLSAPSPAHDASTLPRAALTAAWLVGYNLLLLRCSGLTLPVPQRKQLHIISKRDVTTHYSTVLALLNCTYRPMCNNRTRSFPTPPKLIATASLAVTALPCDDVFSSLRLAESERGLVRTDNWSRREYPRSTRLEWR
jgi:hypothetical protein